jgi:Kinase associated domain 1
LRADLDGGIDRIMTACLCLSDIEYVSPRDNRNNHGEHIVGELTTRVQSDTGENLVLRFEIFIVKVPLFSLHGIQFKKVAGGMINTCIGEREVACFVNTLHGN